jgi:ribonuclease HI
VQNEELEHAIQLFTDGSKSENGVGSGAANFVQNKLTHKMKYKLHVRYSNNQAEQLTIVKALQAIKKIK